MSEMDHVHTVIEKADMTYKRYMLVGNWSLGSYCKMVVRSPAWKNIGGLGVGGWGGWWWECQEKREGKRWRSLAEQIPLSHRVEKGPLSVRSPPPLLFFLTNNAKSWQPTQRHEQQFPIRDKQPSCRLGTSQVCRTTATVRREQPRMGGFEGKEKHISKSSWSDCVRAHHWTSRKRRSGAIWSDKGLSSGGIILLKQRQILAMELVPGL